MRMLKLFVVVVALLCPLVSAAETYDEAMETFRGTTLRARTDEGVIHQINLRERYAIIGGYKYWFGPTFSSTPMKVKLYGSNAGAAELLQPGMKVSVTYGDSGKARIAVSIEQLAPTANVEH